MSHFGVAIEYGLHVLLRLAGLQGETAYLAKIMTQLEKAGLG